MAVPHDLGLLTGVRFECRPGCGLCCFGSPAVDPSEEARLLTIAPAVEFDEGEEGFRLVRTRPEGGACQLLTATRCQVYADRPFPCRVYPLVTHVGTRLQTVPVLGCPGVALTELAEGPRGLDTELAEVGREVARAPLPTWVAEHERALRTLSRRLDRRGQWEDPSTLRAEMGTARLELTGAGLPPPGAETPLEELPIGFDAEHGVLLFRGGEAPEQYEVLRPRESGGADRLGTFEVPDEARPSSGAAARVLGRYQRHLVDCDAFWWSTYLELQRGAEGSLRERFRANLAEALEEAVRRGAVHALLHGESPDPLSAEHVWNGVRWTDSELLDRPTLGRVL
jgi:Fe-S-cluster containining protein